MPSHGTNPRWVLDSATRSTTVEMLSAFAQTFRYRLRLRIPECPLLSAPLGPSCLGMFHCVSVEGRARYAITFDEAHLARRLAAGNWPGILATLLHEQVHLWQLLHGTPGGHNAEFRDKALACGLVISERGVTEAHVPAGPFLTLLGERGLVTTSGTGRRS